MSKLHTYVDKGDIIHPVNIVTSIIVELSTKNVRYYRHERFPVFCCHMVFIFYYTVLSHVQLCCRHVRGNTESIDISGQ